MVVQILFFIGVASAVLLFTLSGLTTPEQQGKSTALKVASAADQIKLTSSLDPKDRCLKVGVSLPADWTLEVTGKLHPDYPKTVISKPKGSDEPEWQFAKITNDDIDLICSPSNLAGSEAGSTVCDSPLKFNFESDEGVKADYCLCYVDGKKAALYRKGFFGCVRIT